MKALIFLISFNLLADGDLTIVHKKAKPIVQSSHFKKVASLSDNSKSLKKLEELSQTTNNLLGQMQEKSGVWDFSLEFDLKTGTVIKGLLLNSITSTNLQSPIVVRVLDNSKLPKDSYFTCKGVSQSTRVIAACNKLIIPNKDDEFEITAGLLNLDGSLGLKADEVYTGKEEYIAGSIATAFSKGLIELKTERLASPLGELTANTAKNRLLNGVMGSLDEASNLMKEEMQNKEAKVYVKAGKEVLVYFFERFKI